MKKKLLTGLLAVLMLVSTAACSGGGESNSSTSSSSGNVISEAGGDESAASQTSETVDPMAEHVTLQVVVYGDKSERMREFESNELADEMNEKLNIDLVVTYLPWSENEGGRSDLMLASGEDFATYTSPTYTARCASKGVLADLTQAAENYLPDLRDVVQAEAFESFTIDGKLYSIPIGNKPNSGEGYCFQVRQDILEEVGMTELTSVEDFEEFFCLAREIYPDITGVSSLNNIGQQLSYTVSDKNIEFVDTRLSDTAMIFTDADADDSTLYSWLESDEFKKTAEITHSWYESGIIAEYALSNPNQLSADWEAGKCLSKFGNAAGILKPDANLLNAVPDAEVGVYYLNRGDRPKLNTQLWNTAWLVSAGAEDPNRYCMLFNYMQQSQENIDFLQYGVEGVDYTVDEAGNITRMTDDGFFDGWMLENKNYMRFDPDVSEDKIEVYTSWDDDSIPAKSLGFSFDDTEVQVERAALDAIVEEYAKPILYGVVAYEDGYEELLSRMEEAGFQKYFDEFQRQFTEWYENR